LEPRVALAGGQEIRDTRLRPQITQEYRNLLGGGRADALGRPVQDPCKHAVRHVSTQ